MNEVAFKMKLKAGFEKEYQKRHDEIWPEMVTVLKNAGVYDYSIYLDKESNTLFAVQKLTDDNTADKLPQMRLFASGGVYGRYHGSQSGQITCGS